jgi:PBSX family phage terminase large subunit
MNSKQEIIRKRRPYEPFGAARTLWASRDDEILITGPAGTGKSRAILEKIVFCCLKYPGTRALIVRKTRESMTESVLVTLEEKVIPENSPAQKGPMRMLRQNYVFPNGSEIVVGGMDKASKVMSTEYDIIGTFESTELVEEDFENLTTRLRNGVMPYQQIIADCNPGPPTHWLNRRASSGKMKRLRSRHSDNPLLYDNSVGKWTPTGEKYLARLQNLTGVRRLRLYEGKWVAAEGQVYDTFDPSIHVIKSFPIPKSWRRIRSIDFGYTNPFVCQWWAIDNDGRMYLYREIYFSKRIVRDHAIGVRDSDGKLLQKGILQYSDGEIFETTIADHDAEDRATLDAEGIESIPAFKPITPGIEAVQRRLRVAGDKKPRMFFFSDALVERDDDLVEAHKPCCTIQEFEGYCYPQGHDGKPIKEEPVKVNDHGCFVASTLVRTRRGDIQIDQLSIEDEVLTRQGYTSLAGVGMTSKWESIWEVKFSDGTKLQGTANHPVWTCERGFVRLDSLRYGDTVVSCRNQRSSSIVESSSDAIPKLRDGRIGCTSLHTSPLDSKVYGDFTSKSGSMLDEKSRKDFTSTIGTRTRATTCCPISNKKKDRLISDITTLCEKDDPYQKQRKSSLQPSVPSRWNGIEASKGVNGIESMLLKISKKESLSPDGVSDAARYTRPKPCGIQNSARMPVEPLPVEIQESMTKHECASNVGKNSMSIDIEKSNSVLVSVLSISETGFHAPVFNLTTKRHAEYFANGILVHNCDLVRYTVAYVDDLSVDYIEVNCGDQAPVIMSAKDLK